MLAIMASDSSVGSLGFNGLTVRRKQNARHQSKAAVTLRDGVRLHVTIIVFASPHIAAGPFQASGDHVVD